MARFSEGLDMIGRLTSIKERIVSRKEIDGIEPWTCPWLGSKAGDAPIPRNFATGQDYRGMEALLLWIAARDREFSSNLWVNAQQIQSLGGSVLSWDKPVDCLSFKSDHSFSVYSVYNIDQVDGLEYPEDTRINIPIFEDFHPIDVLCSICEYKLKDKLFYFPGEKEKAMQADNFDALISEYAFSIVCWYQCYHMPTFRSDLVARIAAAFICAELDVAYCDQHSNHPPHYDSDGWLQQFKIQESFLYDVVAEAFEVYEFLVRDLKVSCVGDITTQKAAI